MKLESGKSVMRPIRRRFSSWAPVQVAAVCYRRTAFSLEFLLVNTSAGKWTFPKGRLCPWLSASESAAREALEEAGVRGRIQESAFPNILISSGRWATTTEAAKSSSQRISLRSAASHRRMKVIATLRGSQPRMPGKGWLSNGQPNMLADLSKLLMQRYEPCARQIRNSSSDLKEDYAGELLSDNQPVLTLHQQREQSSRYRLHSVFTCKLLPS